MDLERVAQQRVRRVTIEVEPLVDVRIETLRGLDEALVKDPPVCAVHPGLENDARRYVGGSERRRRGFECRDLLYKRVYGKTEDGYERPERHRIA